MKIKDDTRLKKILDDCLANLEYNLEYYTFNKMKNKKLIKYNSLFSAMNNYIPGDKLYIHVSNLGDVELTRIHKQMNKSEEIYKELSTGDVVVYNITWCDSTKNNTIFDEDRYNSPIEAYEYIKDYIKTFTSGSIDILELYVSIKVNDNKIISLKLADTKSLRKEEF